MGARVAALRATVICGRMAVNPHTAALNPVALIAARQARSAFIPQVDGYVVIQMPGETMRCPIKNVIDPDTIIVQIDKPPISRVHNFQFEAMVGVRRRVVNGRETWEAQQDKDFLAEQRAMQQMANPPASKAEPPRVAPAVPEKSRRQQKPKPAAKPKAKASAKAKPKRKAGKK